MQPEIRRAIFRSQAHGLLHAQVDAIPERLEELEVELCGGLERGDGEGDV